MRLKNTCTAISRVLLILISVNFSAQAQLEQRHWIFGRASTSNPTNANLDFFSSPGLNPYTTPFPQPMVIPPNQIGGTSGFEGWAIVTDVNNGNLVFYTDGLDIYDANHNQIGSALGGSPSGTQPVVVCPVPICPFNQYYVITNSAGTTGDGTSAGTLSFRIYNVGGSLTASKTPTGTPAGLTGITEGMLLIPHATNPFEYWLIVKSCASPGSSLRNPFLIYRVDASGIMFNSASVASIANGTLCGNPVIVSMASRRIPGTTTVAIALSTSRTDPSIFTNGAGWVGVSMFDAASGSFLFNSASTTQQFPIAATGTTATGIPYDVEFSPNGQYLYYTTYLPCRLFQCEIDPSNGSVIGSPREIQPPSGSNNFGQRGGGVKLAPDGFIYHIADAGTLTNGTSGEANGTMTIGRILQPNSPYSPSSFSTFYEQSVVSFQNVFAYNFPEFATPPLWNASVAVQGSNLLCEGDQTTISAIANTLGIAVANYNWFRNGVQVQNSASPDLTVTTDGNYFCEVVLNGGCTITSNTELITVKECDCCEKTLLRLESIENLLKTILDNN